ncbi:hypothetical protein [Variovorax sp. GB1P17]|uniref:hypothetical protein n=1 Tax=Variovorax sp. GB1P17 TaxID=3443740 RepID=UPI003F49A1FC
MKIRVHEWLADRFSWVQYPDLRREASKQAFRQRHPKPTLLWRYKAMTWRQWGWFWFAVFWTVVALMASIGPSN